MTCETTLNLMTVLALLGSVVSVLIALVGLVNMRRADRLMGRYAAVSKRLASEHADMEQQLYKTQVELDAWKERG